MRAAIVLFTSVLVVIAAAWSAPPAPYSRGDRGSRGDRTSRPTTTTTAAAGPRAATLDDYAILSERNIFVKDRSSRSRSRTPSTTSFSTRRPSSEESYVLTGIVEQGPTRVAFFEDNRSGQTLRTTVGRSIAGGTIRDVTMDGVEYASETSTRKIHVGENLTGSSGSFTAPSLAADSSSQPTTSTSTEPSSRPADATGSGANDILQRMRLRRQQEMNR